MKRLILVLAFALVLSGGVFADSTDYTSTTKTVCDEYGTCTLTLYSGIMQVYEDETWKPIAEARSLLGYYDVVYLEKEDAFNIEVIDFNLTDIELETTFLGHPLDYPDYCIYKSEIEFKCQFKNTIKWDDEFGVEQTIKFDMKYEMKDGIIVANDTKFQYKGYALDKKYSFGGESTTIVLQDANTENLEDAYIYVAGPAGTQKSQKSLIKFDITQVPEGQTIDLAEICVYILTRGDGWDDDINITNINNQTWIETETAATLDKIGPLTNEVINESFGTTANEFTCANITDIVTLNYDASDSNCSIKIQDPDYQTLPSSTISLGTGLGAGEYGAAAACSNCSIIFGSKEWATVAQRPYLEITYSELGDSFDFTISMPATCSVNKGCLGAGCSTCTRCWAEPTDSIIPIDGNIACQGQDNTTPFLVIDFTGSASTFDLNMFLEETPPANLYLRVNSNNALATSTRLTNASQLIIADQTPTGTQDANIWVWGEFEAYYPDDLNVSGTTDLNAGEFN